MVAARARPGVDRWLEKIHARRVREQPAAAEGEVSVARRIGGHQRHLRVPRLVDEDDGHRRLAPAELLAQQEFARAAPRRTAPAMPAAAPAGISVRASASSSDAYDVAGDVVSAGLNDAHLLSCLCVDDDDGVPGEEERVRERLQREHEPQRERIRSRSSALFRRHPGRAGTYGCRGGNAARARTDETIGSEVVDKVE